MKTFIVFDSYTPTAINRMATVASSTRVYILFLATSQFYFIILVSFEFKNMCCGRCTDGKVNQPPCTYTPAESCVTRSDWPHLSEGGPRGPGDLVEGVDGYADHRGQSHEEADGQGPAGVDVVVVGDGLVLDHREDQDKLWGRKDKGG